MEPLPSGAWFGSHSGSSVLAGGQFCPAPERHQHTKVLRVEN